MSMYPGIQPLGSRLRFKEAENFKGMSMKELEETIFPQNPELFSRIAFARGEGIPKVYREAAKRPVDKKMIFFESNLGKQCTGNPRHIYERMLERGIDLMCVWGYNGDPADIPGNPVVVKRGSADYYKILARSRFIVNNTTFPLWYHRSESFYLQTWHGTLYKCMHWDRKSDDVSRSTSGDFFAKSTGWNALLAPNAWSAGHFRSCFRYKGRILDIGYPCNDIFFDKGRYRRTRSRLREKLGIPADAPVYLYAPTWRDGGHLGNAMFRFNLLLDPGEFMKHVPGDARLLIRAHHMSAAADSLAGLPERVIDVSGIDDAHEVMCAADVLVADYSSIVHDWYCSRKPVVYFIPDLERYMKLRDVYYDMTAEGWRAGEICRDQESLHGQVEKMDPFATTGYDEFYERFCSSNDGHACDRAIDFLLGR